MSFKIDDLKLNLEEVIAYFKEDLSKIRSGRVNPQMIEELKVDYYGALSPLKQMASVSSQDARTIVISPWDKDSLTSIEKAINDSDLNVNPNNDGNIIRLNFPPLTEERRDELIKLVGKKEEEARIKVRQTREEVWNDIQKQEKLGEISEDDKFKAKDQLQKVVDEYNNKIEELAQNKEESMREI